MSNEYNNENENKQAGEELNGNQTIDNSNLSSSQNVDNSQNSYSNQYQGYNQYPSNNSNPQNNYSNPYDNLNQAAEVVKPKKKHGFRGFMKLTAAAVAFGLIAGVVFQGYYFVTQVGNTIENNKNVTQIAEVNGNNTDTSGTAIVPTSTSSNEVITDVSDVVEKVMPSIVAINSSGTMASYDFFGRQSNEPFQGSGSGIIISQDDSQILIVTNNHVIESAQDVEIVFADETTVKATIKGADTNADLAVLSVQTKDLSKETAAAIKIATLGNSDNVKAGEMAIAIGNALGYGQSVTVGYISAVNREVTIGDAKMTLLQTDAAINPGNSGGALINAAGEVIGINSVKYASAEVEGMGYAIPISNAVPMINELMNRETVAASEQGFLGIRTDSAQNVTDALAQRFNMPIGVYVNDVVKDSPAEQAGLMQGNIIVGVNDQEVKTIDELINILSYKKAGDTITLKVNVLDNGERVEKNLSVTLGEKQN